MKHGLLLNPEKIIINVSVTGSSFERLAGLLFRPKLMNGEGLLISKCNSVHSCFMRYAIDLIYLNQKYEVTKLVRNFEPFCFSLDFKAKHVLELPAGEIDRLGVVLGDNFTWVPRPE